MGFVEKGLVEKALVEKPAVNTAPRDLHAFQFQTVIKNEMLILQSQAVNTAATDPWEP